MSAEVQDLVRWRFYSREELSYGETIALRRDRGKMETSKLFAHT